MAKGATELCFCRIKFSIFSYFLINKFYLKGHQLRGSHKNISESLLFHWTPLPPVQPNTEKNFWRRLHSVLDKARVLAERFLTAIAFFSNYVM